MPPESENLSNNDFKRLTLTVKDCIFISVPMAWLFAWCLVLNAPFFFPESGREESKEITKSLPRVSIYLSISLIKRRSEKAAVQVCLSMGPVKFLSCFRRKTLNKC